MTKKHKPSTWEKITGIIIYDRDGWRVDGQSFNKPISRKEWNRRQMMSTCRFPVKFFKHKDGSIKH